MVGSRACLLALGLLVLAAGPLHADKVIRNDGGGSVAAYVKEIKRIRQDGERVWVYGRCASACTLYLGLAGQVCTARRAQWMFHGPSSADGETPLDPWVFQFTSESMAKYYPGPLARWFMTKGRYRIGKRFFTKTGKDMMAYGVPECVAVRAAIGGR